MAVEQEMKIPVADLAAIEARLVAAGAGRVQARELEENWVLDDGAQGLRSSGRLLRVRHHGRGWLLTFKGPASYSPNGVKSRLEIETEVTDGEALITIFAGVGLSSARRYQKWREEWRLDGTLVTLDETPMGCFVELEGRSDELPAIAARLGLDPAAAARGSYLDLWTAYRQTHPEVGEDMLFR